MYEIRCKQTKRPVVYGINEPVWNEDFAGKMLVLLAREELEAMECWEDCGTYKRRLM